MCRRKLFISETRMTYGKRLKIFINGKNPPRAFDFPWKDKDDPGGLQRKLRKQLVQDRAKIRSKNERTQAKSIWLYQTTYTPQFTHPNQKVHSATDYN